MRFHSLSILFVAGTASLVGCGDDETTATVVDGITLSGQITKAITSQPIPDAQVCAKEPDHGCVTSNDVGEYSFPNLPKNTRVYFEVSGPNVVPATVYMDFESEDVTANGVAFDEALLTSLYTDAGLTIDLTKGHVIVGVFDEQLSDGNAAGYSATLSPSGGEGPYVSDGAEISTTATKTDSAGVLTFINLDDGEYTAVIDGPGPCQAASPVAYDGNNTAPFRVKAGFIAGAGLDCATDPNAGSGGSGGSGGTSGSGGN
jgi:hypothetical protein